MTDKGQTHIRRVVIMDEGKDNSLQTVKVHIDWYREKITTMTRQITDERF